MRQLLLVEDSKMFGRLAKKKLEEAFDLPVFWTKSMAETIQILDMAKDNFTAALLDYNLPDAPNGEVIDEVIDRGISSIVFTGNIEDEVRQNVWGKKVADYVLKDDPSSLDYVITAIRRLQENQETLVLVVDDSSEHRSMLSELLYVHKFRVLNASTGKAALDIVARHPEVSLVISGYTMPDMDGCTLCRKIRMNHKADSLAFIGIFSESEQNIGARFIKNGASDFIIKQFFLVEEFYCRVNNCVENMRLIWKTKEAAMKDFLTGLYNRRYFFHAGMSLYADSVKNELPLSCAMIDIDHFKKVNDTFGHDVGDIVIKTISDLILASTTGNDIVARFGGEEFCILFEGGGKEDCWRILETLRKKIEATAAATTKTDGNIYVNVSIGLCPDLHNSLEDMIKAADENLYRAKEGGRNRTVV